MIAHDPLHRSGRAELPHPAPTLGEDAKTLARIRMTDSSRRKPPYDKSTHTAPRQMVALASASQDRLPEARYCATERAQRRDIHGHSVVAKVPEKNRTQIGSLFLNRRVQASSQFLFQGSQLGLPSLPHRLSQYRKVSLPGFPAGVRKPQEVKRLRFAVPTLAPIRFRITPELDDARFVSVQRQSEPREPFTQFSMEPFRVVTMLKSHNEVVRKTNENHFSARLLLSP